MLTRTGPPLVPVDTTLTHHDRVRLAVLLGWLLLFVGVLFFGERPVPVSRLEAAVSSQQLREVGVSPPLQGTGDIVQEVRWREGWRRYVVRVDLVTPGMHVVGALPVVHQDMGTRLRSDQPSLQVTRIPEPGTYADMLGRRVPQWVEGARLVLGLAWLMLLVGGPKPWRATRWAWLWLVVLTGLPTYGMVAYLLLSGPTPLVSAPRPGARLLTGGWAFLLAALIGIAVKG